MMTQRSLSSRLFSTEVTDVPKSTLPHPERRVEQTNRKRYHVNSSVGTYHSFSTSEPRSSVVLVRKKVLKRACRGELPSSPGQNPTHSRKSFRLQCSPSFFLRKDSELFRRQTWLHRESQCRNTSYSSPFVMPLCLAAALFQNDIGVKRTFTGCDDGIRFLCTLVKRKAFDFLKSAVGILCRRLFILVPDGSPDCIAGVTAIR